jgi:hypothetical protein
MTPDTPNTASAAARTGPGDAVCFGCEQFPDSPPRPNTQEDNRASEITCASMRAAELRACLVREIIRASAIGMQAQAALLDGDDEAALGHLRRHWIVMRADVSSLAAELLAISGRSENSGDAR